MLEFNYCCPWWDVFSVHSFYGLVDDGQWTGGSRFKLKAEVWLQSCCSAASSHMHVWNMKTCKWVVLLWWVGCDIWNQLSLLCHSSQSDQVLIPVSVLECCSALSLADTLHCDSWRRQAADCTHARLQCSALPLCVLIGTGVGGMHTVRLCNCIEVCMYQPH